MRSMITATNRNLPTRGDYSEKAAFGLLSKMWRNIRLTPTGSFSLKDQQGVDLASTTVQFQVKSSEGGIRAFMSSPRWQDSKNRIALVMVSPQGGMLYFYSIPEWWRKTFSSVLSRWSNFIVDRTKDKL